MTGRKYYAMQHKISQQRLMKENNGIKIGDHDRMQTQT
jgi:hypothetical protein